MNSSARSMSIKTRLSLIVLIVGLGVMAISAFFLYTQQRSLLDDRKVKTRHLVEAAHGVLVHYHGLQTQGAMTEEQAKSAALGVIKALRYDEKEYFWINDLQPRVIMHPMKPELDGKDVSGLQDPNGKRLFVAFADTVRQEGAGFVEYQWPKPGAQKPVDKISYVQGFTPWGWVVGSGIYIDDIQAIFLNSVKWVVAIILALMLLIFIALQLIIRSITMPLSELQQAMRSIQSNNDLGQRVRVARHDEVGEIAQSFNEMLASFQAIIKQVIGGVHEVFESSEHLREASQKVSESSRQQSESAASMAAATEEMLTSIEHVAENARHTYGIVRQSGELSQRGESIVNSAAQEMNKIAEAVNVSSTSIDQLGRESDRISEIVKVIREIADQTNLLALNAAIEAARAGEQGRGFAVVADEVRKLAERTSHSTLEISNMIEKIQAETGDAVTGMRQGTARVKDGVELAQQAGLSMANIREGASQVITAVNEITTAIDEQSQAGSQVAQGVERIAQMADQNNVEVADIAATSERLANLAESLQNAVDQFKV